MVSPPVGHALQTRGRNLFDLMTLVTKHLTFRFIYCGAELDHVVANQQKSDWKREICHHAPNRCYQYYHLVATFEINDVKMCLDPSNIVSYRFSLF